MLPRRASPLLSGRGFIRPGLPHTRTEEGASVQSPLSSTSRLARISAKHPWRMVATWVVVLIAAFVVQGFAPLDTTTNTELLNNPESTRGWEVLEEHGIR